MPSGQLPAERKAAAPVVVVSKGGKAKPVAAKKPASVARVPKKVIKKADAPAEAAEEEEE